MNKNKILILIIAFLLSFTLTSCLDFGTTTIETNTTQESVSKKHIYTKNPYIDLYVGETAYLQYTIDFDIDDGEALEFSSSDSSIARVISTGFVAAKAPGTCKITVKYLDECELTYFVTVSQDYEFNAPLKSEYYIDDSLDLEGAEILILNNDKTINRIVPVTNDMVEGFDTSKSGEKTVTVKYNGSTFSFKINVLERQFEPFMISSISVPDGIRSGERFEITITPKDMEYLLKNVSSVYDYDEFKIVLDIVSPSGKTDSVDAFYFQDYVESKKELKTMSSGMNYEGQVNSKEGYNFKLTLSKKGSTVFKVRYIPEEIGQYTFTLKTIVKKTNIVETKAGEFNVTKGEDQKGVIQVSNNNKTFEFENGDTYIAVGENVAWYTSAERRYYDYDMWFKSLSENGVNYARVWLSAFGFCLFWDDVYNYDKRLDEAYELDRIFELAESYGIYIDLTIYHHGMFSAKTNPMWPNDINTWYTNKYGSNPYAKILSSPGEFFTDKEAIRMTKNYLEYIVARYGSTYNLMSYELFNEVDWVEEYTSTIGNTWHDEMSKYIKSKDYLGHMVTTSVKGDDFSSGIYSVFQLGSIDYVNVHNYGSYNYLNVIAKKAQSAYQKFGKPIMYQEVGYNGNGGSYQIKADPNDITLHQELWAGIMSVGASGMNWWWDSWIEPNNSYSKFMGPAKFASLIDLSGNMNLVYRNSNVSNTSSYISSIGYLFNDKAYIYLYDNDYNVSSTGHNRITTLSLSNMTSGQYEVMIYDTYTGEATSTSTVSAIGGKVSITLTVKDDSALIIKKK